MDRLRQVMRGGGDEEAPVLSTDVADGVCGSLSWTTRLRGFAVCLLVGLFLSVVVSGVSVMVSLNC